MRLTVLLFLLPFISIAQCESPSVVDGFSFSQLFTTDCDFDEPWQPIYLPCHGALNKRPEVRRFEITSPTEVTLTANTSQGDNVVATIWDGCPYNGGALVASRECGGYDCVVENGVQLSFVVYLEVGTYYFWIGLFSDGINCTGGFVNGNIVFNGECPPCPTFTMTGAYEEFTYCGGENPEPFDTQTPCGVYTHYYTVAFEAQQPYTSIAVTSALQQNFDMGGVINFAHISVVDECNGDVMFNTYGLACSVGSDLALTGGWPSQNYTVDLALPDGDYILVFGYATQPLQFGCVTVGIGNPVFLELVNEEEFQIQESPNVLFRKPRKILHPMHGVLIEHPNGRLTDLMNRQLN
jgi:hypothetical protein